MVLGGDKCSEVGCPDEGASVSRNKLDFLCVNQGEKKILRELFFRVFSLPVQHI